MSDSSCWQQRDLKTSASCYTQFHIGDVNLPEVSAMKDLGVTVDSNMKFSLQISNIARKANTRAKLILMCFHSRDTQTLLRAFTT